MVQLSAPSRQSFESARLTRLVVGTRLEGFLQSSELRWIGRMRSYTKGESQASSSDLRVGSCFSVFVLPQTLRNPKTILLDILDLGSEECLAAPRNVSDVGLWTPCWLFLS